MLPHPLSAHSSLSRSVAYPIALCRFRFMFAQKSARILSIQLKCLIKIIKSYFQLMAQAIAQQTRQRRRRRRRRSIKVKIQRPRPLATPPLRSDCIDGHLNYAHIVKRAFAN